MAVTKVNYRRCAALGAGIIVFIILVKTLLSVSVYGHVAAAAQSNTHEALAAVQLDTGRSGDSTLSDQQKPLRPASSEPLNVKVPLRQRLNYIFPYDPYGKFPNYIWQTYKTTPGDGGFGQELRPLEASWTERHPGFVHEVIDDEVARHMLRHFYGGFPDVLEAYDSLPLVVHRADFFRYLILLARGGIYSDIDTFAIKSAVDWVPDHVPRSAYGMVIGIEADPDREDWALWYSRRIQFAQWTIQSKPGHPVLQEIVARITEETLLRKSQGTLDNASSKVVESTGPALWTDIIMEYFNDNRYFDMDEAVRNITYKDFTGMEFPKKVGDVVVLPITCFSPGIRTMGAGEDDDPMAYVKHYFEGMWKPEAERHIGENQDQKVVVQGGEGSASQEAANAGVAPPRAEDSI